VTESGSLQELIHEATDNSGVQGAAFAMGVHVLFQILFTVFEYKYEFRFRVDDVVEAYDVDVLELLHEGDFPDGGGWGTFFCIEMNFLQGHDLVGVLRAAFVNGSVGTLACRRISTFHSLR